MSNVTGHDRSLPPTEILLVLLNIFLLVIEPLLIIIGLTGNILVLVVMPKQGVLASKSAKFYYITMAIANFLDIIVGWFIRSFLSETLSMYTNGAFTIDLYKYSTWSCKMVFGIWTWLEILANYTLVAMGIERIIAVW